MGREEDPAANRRVHSARLPSEAEAPRGTDISACRGLTATVAGEKKGLRGRQPFGLPPPQPLLFTSSPPVSRVLRKPGMRYSLPLACGQGRERRGFAAAAFGRRRKTPSHSPPTNFIWKMNCPLEPKSTASAPLMPNLRCIGPWPSGPGATPGKPVAPHRSAARTPVPAPRGP